MCRRFELLGCAECLQPIRDPELGIPRCSRDVETSSGYLAIAGHGFVQLMHQNVRVSGFYPLGFLWWLQVYLWHFDYVWYYDLDFPMLRGYLWHPMFGYGVYTIGWIEYPLKLSNQALDAAVSKTSFCALLIAVQQTRKESAAVSWILWPLLILFWSWGPQDPVVHSLAVPCYTWRYPNSWRVWIPWLEYSLAINNHYWLLHDIIGILTILSTCVCHDMINHFPPWWISWQPLSSLTHHYARYISYHHCNLIIKAIILMTNKNIHHEPLK